MQRSIATCAASIVLIIIASLVISLINDSAPRYSSPEATTSNLTVQDVPTQVPETPETQES